MSVFVWLAAASKLLNFHKVWYRGPLQKVVEQGVLWKSMHWHYFGDVNEFLPTISIFLDLFHEIWYKISTLRDVQQFFHANQCSERHTLTKGISIILNYHLRFHQVWKKFGGESCHIMLLSICEFSENEFTERCISHKDITQLCLFFYFFCPILIKFSSDVHKTLLAHY